MQVITEDSAMILRFLLLFGLADLSMHICRMPCPFQSALLSSTSTMCLSSIPCTSQINAIWPTIASIFSKSDGDPDPSVHSVGIADQSNIAYHSKQISIALNHMIGSSQHPRLSILPSPLHRDRRKPPVCLLGNSHKGQTRKGMNYANCAD